MCLKAENGVRVKVGEWSSGRRAQIEECRQVSKAERVAISVLTEVISFRNGTRRTLERKKRGFPAVTELSDSYTAKSIICRLHSPSKSF